jgi:hypothetical protein
MSECQEGIIKNDRAENKAFLINKKIGYDADFTKNVDNVDKQ